MGDISGGGEGGFGKQALIDASWTWTNYLHPSDDQPHLLCIQFDLVEGVVAYDRCDDYDILNKVEFDRSWYCIIDSIAMNMCAAQNVYSWLNHLVFPTRFLVYKMISLDAFMGSLLKGIIQTSHNGF